MGVPGTFTPAVVPNENVALVTLVAAVTPAIAKVNVADWFKNALCAGLPAIDPFAAA